MMICKKELFVHSAIPFYKYIYKQMNLICETCGDVENWGVAVLNGKCRGIQTTLSGRNIMTNGVYEWWGGDKNPTRPLGEYSHEILFIIRHTLTTSTLSLKNKITDTPQNLRLPVSFTISFANSLKYFGLSLIIEPRNLH